MAQCKNKIESYERNKSYKLKNSFNMEVIHGLIPWVCQVFIYLYTILNLQLLY